MKNSIAVSALIFLVLSVMIPAPATAAQGCSHNCKDCHKITKSEAKKVISKHQGDVAVLDIHMAPVKGLWEAVIEKDNQKGVVYVDFEKKNVIYGVIVNDKGNRNLTQESMEKAIKVKKSDLKLSDRLYIGNSKAQQQLVLFLDPKCSQCAQFYKEAQKLVTKRKDIGFHIVLFPLNTINPGSYERARSIYCSQSLANLELSFQGKDIPAPAKSCNAKIFDDNIAVAGKAGVSGTPTVVLPNGSISFGLITADVLESLINKSH